ncbi:hypothetical protein PG994_010055 [Apiospora phragmitis]|uniref:DUF6536 domain-containing protein n=1 Tax=Apiospora phragmitis TaxID=2905665 RepID=A0ABR1TNT4_9PEZI
MEAAVPSRGKGDQSYINTYDKDGVTETVEPATLESISEGVRLDSSGPGAQKQPRKMPSKQSMQWPFHRRMASDSPSSVLTSHFRRPSSSWNNLKSFFKVEEDTVSLSSKPLVPDYVVHYIRGETPETLAKKREQRRNGQRMATVTPQRERFMSQQVELEDPWASRTKLNLDGNGYANEGRQRGVGKYLAGWKGGATCNIILAFVLLVLAVICLILAMTRQVVAGETIIFSGSCDMASSINTGLHAAINVFAITILVGSNYVFQILSSPTRLELASAHKKKQWLDIGIPSLRNLFHVSGLRTALIAVALLCAVTTQIIYNAVIFTSPTGFKSDIVVVTNDFLTGAPFANGTEFNRADMSQPDILSLQNDARAGKLADLATVPCLQQVGGEFDTTYDALVLITKLSSARSSVIQTGKSGDMFQLNSMSSVAISVPVDEKVVDRCLGRQGLPQTCKVSVSSPLLGIVGALHLITLFSMAAVLSWRNFEPLVSLGDAIRSFMRNPDPSTASACFLDKQDVREGRWGFNEAKYFTPTDHFWFFTPSIKRWVLTIVSWIMITAPTAAAVALIIEHEPTGTLTPLATATPYTTFLLGDSTTPSLTHMQAAVLASVPQLLLAILYLTTNSLLTTYWLSHEMSFFAIGLRPLRVSADPVGYQTTSLYLTLPRPISWALYVLFVAMSFVLSQAVFPAIVSTGTARVRNTEIVGVGFSTLALLILLALLVVLILGVLALGLRRAPAATYADGAQKGNPLALRGGACSAVLSAKCHPAPGEPERAWRCPLVYGVTTEPVGAQQVGHCAFSSVSVGAVDAGKIYA